MKTFVTTTPMRTLVAANAIDPTEAEVEALSRKITLLEAKMVDHSPAAISEKVSDALTRALTPIATEIAIMQKKGFTDAGGRVNRAGGKFLLPSGQEA